jgi:hypothetical protein
MGINIKVLRHRCMQTQGAVCLQSKDMLWLLNEIEALRFDMREMERTSMISYNEIFGSQED